MFNTHTSTHAHSFCPNNLLNEGAGENKWSECLCELCPEGRIYLNIFYLIITAYLCFRGAMKQVFSWLQQKYKNLRPTCKRNLIVWYHCDCALYMCNIFAHAYFLLRKARWIKICFGIPLHQVPMLITVLILTEHIHLFFRNSFQSCQCRLQFWGRSV